MSANESTAKSRHYIYFAPTKDASCIDSVQIAADEETLCAKCDEIGERLRCGDLQPPRNLLGTNYTSVASDVRKAASIAHPDTGSIAAFTVSLTADELIEMREFATNHRDSTIGSIVISVTDTNPTSTWDVIAGHTVELDHKISAVLKAGGGAAVQKLKEDMLVTIRDKLSASQAFDKHFLPSESSIDDRKKTVIDTLRGLDLHEGIAISSVWSLEADSRRMNSNKTVSASSDRT